MGGLGSEKQVKLICKCFSIRAQCFLPFVNILPGARDMFCQILGLSAETRDIPIPSYLKIMLKMSPKTKFFYLILVILTGFSVVSRVFL